MTDKAALDSAITEWAGSLDDVKNLVSERALTGETMLLNMGPHHPSTHGVLRLLLELDGEEIITCLPDIGFLHTGIEKTIESKTYEKGVPSHRPDGLPVADVQ
jgi:NADH dehydrogenase subunit D (EC 1.6.5.3)